LLNKRTIILVVLATGALCLVPRDVEAQTYVAELSCTSGPYRLRLPKTYRAVRALAPLKRERVLRKEDQDGYAVVHRELRFNGLELELVTFSNKPNQYVLSGAILSSPSWKIGGQLRVGAPAKAALRGLLKKDLPKEGELEFTGDTDSIRVTLARGRVLDVEYSCHGA